MSMQMITTFARSAVVAALCLLFASTAKAQYFGTNKVQYHRFDFQVLTTEHFDIYYYPEEEAAVRLAARMAERWYTRLSELLRHELSSRQPLILYASHPHFQQTNAIEGQLGEGTGGVTESLKRRVILPFAGGLAETDHVLGHELVHAFQYDIGRRTDEASRTTAPAVGALPLWFIEGMAEYLSLGPVDSLTAMWIREAASREALPSVDDLDNPRYFPYRYGHAFWAYVAGRWGDRVVGDMLRATGPRGDIEGAIQAVLGVDEPTLSRDWHAATYSAYARFVETTQKPQAFARPLISRETSGGELNLAPSLSPDGRRVVFLSERSMFSIDMYVADTMTGRVQRKIVETAGDAHFDSLQFLSSAGDWAPDNRRFVFAALSKGRPVLAIVDVDRGAREREYPLATLDEVFNPAWSPDGRQIAFSAMKGGVLDLYLLDLDNGSVRQLTNDPFADMDPEWFPDGSELAWVTDRFSSDLDELSFGGYGIGALDVRSGTVRPLAGFDTGRNSNPEFSADGRSLYFIGTPDGIPNIYRIALGGNAAPVRLTNLLSGVSGITAMTPALSVAARAPQVVFTIFENDQYTIYAADPAREAAVAKLDPDLGNAAMLPPSNRQAGTLTRMLATPAAGLAAPVRTPPEDYRASLSIDGMAQPSVGVGVDRFGAYGAGGIALNFSDMLGDHSLMTMFQVNGGVDQIGGAAMYLNRKGRWNWGVIGEYTPYVSGAFAQAIETAPGGQQTVVQQSLRFTQINRGVSAITQYPFSRAMRAEFTGGLRQIAFAQELRTDRFSLATGQLIGEERQELPSPESLNLGDASAALVYDTAISGATGPIVGQRYRLELSQSAGSLAYSGLLLDYRRYLMPVRPFTLAFRGTHYGRYGRDSEDPRLNIMYLGSQGLVRGYDYNSFDAVECEVVGTSSCVAFDRLIGSRIAVASAELRFPLFGLFSRRSFYGPLPLDVALFGDIGAAWTKDTQRAFFDGERDWVKSVGVAMRVNAMGFAVVELDYVRPLDRPGRGWLWQFNLMPAF
jgi:Tol biopolymer transport system component